MLRCDHCNASSGTPDDALPHPREPRALCPACWAEGFEADVREALGPLMEAVAPPEPGPRVPKAVVDWSDDEWNAYQREQNARAAHARADVRLPTALKGAAQLGFDFMREPFKVAPRGAYARRGRKGG